MTRAANLLSNKFRRAGPKGRLKPNCDGVHPRDKKKSPRSEVSFEPGADRVGSDKRRPEPKSRA
jgi:hypothetical protein